MRVPVNVIVTLVIQATLVAHATRNITKTNPQNHLPVRVSGQAIICLDTILSQSPPDYNF